MVLIWKLFLNRRQGNYTIQQVEDNKTQFSFIWNCDFIIKKKNNRSTSRMQSTLKVCAISQCLAQISVSFWLW